jgi:hypothetical protein
MGAPSRRSYAEHRLNAAKFCRDLHFVVRISQNIVNVNGATLPDSTADNRAEPCRNWMARHIGLQFWRMPIRRDLLVSIVFLPINRRHIGFAKARRRLN